MQAAAKPVPYEATYEDQQCCLIGLREMLEEMRPTSLRHDRLKSAGEYRKLIDNAIAAIDKAAGAP